MPNLSMPTCCLLAVLATPPLCAAPIDFCRDPAPAPRVEERVVRFEIQRDIFSLFAQQPVAVKHDETAELRVRLQVKGGKRSALRYTGSPAEGAEAAPPICDPKVEEAPHCDGATTPVYDAFIANRDELEESCQPDLSRMLCVRELDSHLAHIKITNQQACKNKVRVGLLLTVKSTQPVTVGEQVYARQFQTPDPTVILEPAGGPGEEPAAPE